MVIIFNNMGKIQEAKNLPFGTIGTKICEEHVTLVWNAVGNQMRTQIASCHGCKIPELLSLSFKLRQQDVAVKAAIFEKYPHLLISRSLAVKYALYDPRPLYALAPEVPLNICAICIETGLSKAIVKRIIDDVIQAFHRALVCDTCVEFHIPFVGRLIIRGGQVSSVFCREFLDSFGLSCPQTLNKETWCSYP